MTDSVTPLSLRILLLASIGESSRLLFVEMDSWCRRSQVDPASWVFPFKACPGLVGVDLPESCLDLDIVGVRAPLIEARLV